MIAASCSRVPTQAWNRSLSPALGLSLLIWFLTGSLAGAGGVQGQVVDDQGAGIEGVRILIVQVGGEQGPWTVLTDEDGRYRINDVLIFGNLDVTPSKTGVAFLPPLRSFFDPSGVGTLTADFTGFDHPIVSVTRIEIQDSGARFETTVNPLGFPTSLRFEYGPTPQLGGVTPVLLERAGCRCRFSGRGVGGGAGGVVVSGRCTGVDFGADRTRRDGDYPSAGGRRGSAVGDVGRPAHLARSGLV